MENKGAAIVLSMLFGECFAIFIFLIILAFVLGAIIF